MLNRSAKPTLVPGLAEEAEHSLEPQIEQIAELVKVASKHPYYQYNVMWTRDVQDTVRLDTHMSARRDDLFIY